MALAHTLRDKKLNKEGQQLLFGDYLVNYDDLENWIKEANISDAAEVIIKQNKNDDVILQIWATSDPKVALPLIFRGPAELTKENVIIRLKNGVKELKHYQELYK